MGVNPRKSTTTATDPELAAANSALIQRIGWNQNRRKQTEITPGTLYPGYCYVRKRKRNDLQSQTALSLQRTLGITRSKTMKSKIDNMIQEMLIFWEWVIRSLKNTSTVYKIARHFWKKTCFYNFMLDHLKYTYSK